MTSGIVSLLLSESLPMVIIVRIVITIIVVIIKIIHITNILIVTRENNSKKEGPHESMRTSRATLQTMEARFN